MSFLLSLLIYFCLGLIVGTTVVIYDVIQTWKQGEDITLGDIGKIIVVVLIFVFFWPIIFAIYLYELVVEKYQIGSNTVVLSGNRKVKMLKAMKDR